MYTTEISRNWRSEYLLPVASILATMILPFGCRTESRLPGAWAFDEIVQSYSLTPGKGRINEEWYGDLETGDELAIVIRHDGTFDLGHSMYAMLGPGIERLTQTDQQYVVDSTYTDADGTVKVKSAEYTLKRSYLHLLLDVDYFDATELVFEAKATPNGLSFRHVVKNGSSEEHVFVAKLQRYKGELPTEP